MKYYSPDYGETLEDAVPLRDCGGVAGHDAHTAERAAKCIFDERGGRNTSWPITLVLTLECGQRSEWQVDCETAASFHVEFVPPETCWPLVLVPGDDDGTDSIWEGGLDFEPTFSANAPRQKGNRHEHSKF